VYLLMLGARCPPWLISSCRLTCYRLHNIRPSLPLPLLLPLSLLLPLLLLLPPHM
jgi:hypothetical protein